MILKFDDKNLQELSNNEINEFANVLLKQINELMDYSIEQDVSEENLEIAGKLILIYPLGILLLGL